MAETLQPYVLAAVKRCLDSGEYSDLTITCGSDVHKVHKMIVCTQSDFLAAAIRFGGKESKQANINLPDDEPAIVKLAVHYIYTGDYICDSQEPINLSSPLTSGEKPSRNEEGESYTYDFPHSCSDRGRRKQCLPLCPHHQCGAGYCDNECFDFLCRSCEDGDYNARSNPKHLAEDLLVHTKAYEIADKYNIAGLKELSKAKFKKGCEKYWYTNPFRVAAKYAFSTTLEEDKGLRDIVIDTVAQHTILIREPQIQVLMKEFGDLALGVLLKKADHSLTSGLSSDLTITCGPDSHAVHQQIICPRAEFFARALKFGGQETSTSEINLPEDDPAIIKLLLQYLYEGDYHLPSSPSSPSPPVLTTRTKKRPTHTPAGLPYTYDFPHTCHPPLTPHTLCPHHTCTYTRSSSQPTPCNYTCTSFTCPLCTSPPPAPAPYAGSPADLITHAELYAVADKYQVPSLKPLIVKRFSHACARFWGEPEFVDAARCVFQSTPERDGGLRRVVLKTLFEHLGVLIRSEGVARLVREEAEVAVGVLRLCGGICFSMQKRRKRRKKKKKKKKRSR
ncbi:hypothetical protein COCMIDRAFT_40241 [Bipolaris oryzae ATCC 44560]|uniref:BTB domain-containing protein n=1 Tax=Bipolaris oryzae ATCC 44560 TaxID=930090 RepID=W6ZCX2_COCMI|nr:uncharacterized protein COCMIDRAFT_40241 [Bipolaris oryzae ATCC 44560]EUC41591.1 hypothetical protein COCMIDRAFT_40241 [Bipolaris oryzae ATCC 44560]